MLFMGPGVRGATNEAVVCCPGLPERREFRGAELTLAPPARTKSAGLRATTVSVWAIPAAVATRRANMHRGMGGDMVLL